MVQSREELNAVRRAAWRKRTGKTGERPVANPEAEKARRRERYAADPEPQKARSKAWLQANQERARANRAVWREANPEKHRDQKRRDKVNRRARLAGAWIEAVDPAIVWERDGGICHLCGELADRATWNLDHVLPLACGGLHCYANVAVSHEFCNKSKGGRCP